MIAIIADSRRETRCRRCGQTVVVADLLHSRRVVAFDPPLVLVPTLPLNERGEATAFVDRQLTREHAETCAKRLAQSRAANAARRTR